MGRIDETRRVSRLLDIAWHIAAAPRQWTRKRLATLYEVSEQQITSDLTLMRHGLHWQVRTCPFKADRIAAVAPRVMLDEIPADFNNAYVVGLLIADDGPQQWMDSSLLRHHRYIPLDEHGEYRDPNGKFTLHYGPMGVALDIE